MEHNNAIVIAAKDLQIDIRDEEGKANKQRFEEELVRLIELFLVEFDERD